MLDAVLNMDQWLFRLINTEWHNSFFDFLMPVLREKKNWIPLYLAVAIFSFFKMPWKRAILFIGFAGITVGIADTLSSKIIKPAVERPRPCRDCDDGICNQRLLVNCGGGYSFTSSHAVNHFAIAAFFHLSLLSFWKGKGGLWYFWAASIAFAQVYVGVHYPFDVLAGTAIGFFIGLAMASLFQVFKFGSPQEAS